MIGKPVTSEDGNSHLVSPSSCVGQAVFGLIPAPWALAVFCARLRTKSKGHFSRYYKSAVKTRQRVILLFVGLLVLSCLSWYFLTSPLIPSLSREEGLKAKEA